MVSRSLLHPSPEWHLKEVKTQLMRYFFLWWRWLWWYAQNLRRYCRYNRDHIRQEVSEQKEPLMGNFPA